MEKTKYDVLAKENETVIGLVNSLGESMVARIKSERMLGEEKIPFNNTVFEDIYLSKVQDFVNLSLGIKK